MRVRKQEAPTNEACPAPRPGAYLRRYPRHRCQEEPYHRAALAWEGRDRPCRRIRSVFTGRDREVSHDQGEPRLPDASRARRRRQATVSEMVGVLVTRSSEPAALASANRISPNEPPFASLVKPRSSPFDPAQRNRDTDSIPGGKIPSWMPAAPVAASTVDSEA